MLVVSFPWVLLLVFVDPGVKLIGVGVGGFGVDGMRGGEREEELLSSTSMLRPPSMLLPIFWDERSDEWKDASEASTERVVSNIGGWYVRGRGAKRAQGRLLLE